MKKFNKITAVIGLSCMLTVIPLQALAADQSYINNDTGYYILISDEADLLTDTEEENLVTDMQDITQYGNVVFKSIDSNPYGSASTYAESYYHELYGTESGTLFLIDMDCRKIYIFSDGTNYDIVSESEAETITDNVYRYASDGDYYDCAATAFGQINTILDGNEIARPMKYISNALLALMIAMLINFIIVSSKSRLKKASGNALVNAAIADFQMDDPQAQFLNESKRYDPVEHGSGGGGGGFSGGGGGFSGGGSSGGGGGHSF